MKRNWLPRQLGIILLGVLSTAPALAFAQGEVPVRRNDPALQGLIDEALEKNPALRQAREEAEAARLLTGPAGAPIDPMILATYENDGFKPSLGSEGMTRFEFMVEQSFPFPGRLKFARAIAQTDADVVSIGIQRIQLTVESAVRRAFANLMEIRELQGLTQEQEQLWTQIEEVTRVRYSSGEGGQVDILRAQGEQTRLVQQRIRERTAEQRALLELRRLLQREPGSPIEANGRLAGEGSLEVPSVEEVRRLAMEVSPELKEAKLLGNRAVLSRDLAKRSLGPDFVASASYMNRGALPMMWSLGLGISVPIWARTKQMPRIAEAESRGRAAKLLEEDIQQRLLARTEERRLEMSQLAEEAAIDTSGILVQDRLALEAALASYRTGTASFLSVLEALSTYFQDRRRAVNRLADYRRTEALLFEFSPEGTEGSSMQEKASRPSVTGGAGAGM
jgi:outer membrane protein TolC